jgi:hypothetical protein
MLTTQAYASSPALTIVTDLAPGEVAVHGLNKLVETLKAQNIAFEKVSSLGQANGKRLIVVGLASGNGPAAGLLEEGGHTVPQVSQALTVWQTTYAGKPTTVVAGYDDVGTMYATLDVADRISWSNAKHPMRYVKEITSEPFVKERGIAMYTMHRRYWESRFYDEKFWEEYFDMMARNRLNMLEILFGYENGGWMAPCYPYFFDVEGFPEVKIEDISPERQAANVEAMHRLMRMAHERGIGVRLGIWDHIYKGGVQTGGNPAFEYKTGKYLSWQVQGLETAGNLIPYTKAAFAKLLRTFPEMDAVLFKTNNESGLKTEELHDFSVSFFETVAAVAPGMRIDIHSKGLTDTLINTAIALGLNFRIAPKFWMEQLGLPFSPTHVNREDQHNRRHGYADMLRYPQHYEMLWKLWNGGTNRAFLWGSMEYVRRFAESSRLYGSSAYEVYEPLATKMESEFHDVTPFELLNPKYTYYDYEFERWWHFFQLWGLVGYNPDTPEDVWIMEFARRFGGETGEILRSALEDASWVMPRIIASCYPYSYFPTTGAWPEKERLGNLPLYARAEGSDLQQFASFDQEAQVLLGELETAKVLPSTTSRWLGELSEKINVKVARAEKTMKDTSNKEFISTVTDLKMLSRMALYHSRRVPAAVSYCLFKRTGDAAALNEAIRHEENAVRAWAEMVDAAGDVFAGNIKIGHSRLSGHWRDELAALNRGLELLKKERAEYVAKEGTALAPLYKAASAPNNSRYFTIHHNAVESAPVGKPITVKIKVSAASGVKWVRLQYRAVNQYLDFAMLPMTPTEEKDVYSATIPTEAIHPAWDVMYLIEAMDREGHGIIYPDLDVETPYRIVHLKR